MKKILFGLAVLPLLAFVGCSSDDDDNNNQNGNFGYPIQMLHGEWSATEVEVDEGTLDLTDPVVEMIVDATTVTFAKDGTFSSKGIVGEGTGRYVAKDKTITVSVKEGETVSFKVKSLDDKTAKVEVNADDIDFGDLKTSEEIKTVTLVLKKDYTPEVGFDHDIELLYGKWRATSVEIEGEEPIDITSPVMEDLVPPTYVTFDNEGVYTSEGIMGEGTGIYGVKGERVSAFLNEEIISFNMTELKAETARINLNAKALELPMIPAELETVVVVLTKIEIEE